MSDSTSSFGVGIFKLVDQWLPMRADEVHCLRCAQRMIMGQKGSHFGRKYALTLLGRRTCGKSTIYCPMAWNDGGHVGHP